MVNAFFSAVSRVKRNLFSHDDQYVRNKSPHLLIVIGVRLCMGYCESWLNYVCAHTVVCHGETEYTVDRRGFGFVESACLTKSLLPVPRWRLVGWLICLTVQNAMASLTVCFRPCRILAVLTSFLFLSPDRKHSNWYDVDCVYLQLDGR